jgi:hypothetical protein
VILAWMGSVLGNILDIALQSVLFPYRKNKLVVGSGGGLLHSNMARIISH